MSLIERLQGQGRVEVTAVYDADPDKRDAAAERLGLSADIPSDVAVCTDDDVDVVLDPHQHARARPARPRRARGRQARAGREARGHDAGGGRAGPRRPRSPRPATWSARRTSCSRRPTGRCTRASARGEIGGLLTARARYGWAGPDWSRWFYEPGGGALFDLGVYNVTSLCGFFGPAQRVTAMTGVAIPERIIDGEPIQVRAEDNAHVLIDFGDARFAVVTTGFTMQAYRSPALELYGYARRAAAARRRLGARGPRAVPQGDRRVGAAPRDRPDVAVDGRAAPPRRRASRTGRSRSRGPSTRSTRSRSCSPPRPPAPTAGRARSTRTSRSPTSRGSARSAAHERVHDPRSAL